MFCGNCGKELEDIVAFCPYCGCRLPEEIVKNSGTQVVRKQEEKGVESSNPSNSVASAETIEAEENVTSLDLQEKMEEQPKQASPESQEKTENHTTETSSSMQKEQTESGIQENANPSISSEEQSEKGKEKNLPKSRKKYGSILQLERVYSVSLL
ncbi:MAG: zinc ribbon domain-containing protein [Lachnospiraceae bacterium]|nr:zinc ribbon domain-containing protein [Lachnospiraceae bacterium]